MASVMFMLMIVEYINRLKMKKILIYIITFIFVITVIALWASYPVWGSLFFDYLNSYEVLSKFANSYGTFGDSFGVLNTLFSGLAFTGIIFSIFLQSKELSETRNEIKAQCEQFELQTKVMNKQVFENVFFQMITLHNEIVQSITIDHYDGMAIFAVKSRGAFKPLYVQKFCQSDFISELDLDERDYPQSFNDYYLKFHDCYGDQIGHYFRNVYQILKLIDSSDVDDKKFYSNIIRSQLSSYELVMLFYNCLSDIGVDLFKPLVEKYEFFEHLPLLDFMSAEDIKNYSVCAYGVTNKKLINIHEDIYNISLPKQVHKVFIERENEKQQCPTYKNKVERKRIGEEVRKEIIRKFS